MLEIGTKVRINQPRARAIHGRIGRVVFIENIGVVDHVVLLDGDNTPRYLMESELEVCVEPRAWVDGVFYIARPIVLVGMLAMSAGASASVASAHAGNHAAGHLGSTAHANQAASVNSTRSNGGGAYINNQPDGDADGDVVDNYQPWPESTMRQFQKQ